jgi:hypothetical protein
MLNNLKLINIIDFNDLHHCLTEITGLNLHIEIERFFDLFKD